MIVIDTSAILAILLGEPEGDTFERLITVYETLIGAPTLVEARLVLEGRLPDRAEEGLRRFLADHPLNIVPFDAAMFEIAIDAFARYGKGRGHPAKLNFGDCFTYAVVERHALPLLFKGGDFVHTDLVPAYLTAP